VAAQHDEINPIRLGSRDKPLGREAKLDLGAGGNPASTRDAATAVRESVAAAISDSITCSFISGTGASPPL